ncbi:acylphosphatase [candidate division KSB1 bacterium]|nr:acylphosphatase [candidate division KSB1 bacterium]
MDVCAHITVHGVVQGVGFRYFAYREAQSYKLKGYVRNNTDGSVESEVEGQKPYVEAYIGALHRGSSYSHVTGINIKWKKYENKYKSFYIS